MEKATDNWQTLRNEIEKQLELCSKHKAFSEWLRAKSIAFKEVLGVMDRIEDGTQLEYVPNKHGGWVKKAKPSE